MPEIQAGITAATKTLGALTKILTASIWQQVPFPMGENTWDSVHE